MADEWNAQKILYLYVHNAIVHISVTPAMKGICPPLNFPIIDPNSLRPAVFPLVFFDLLLLLWAFPYGLRSVCYFFCWVLCWLFFGFFFGLFCPSLFSFVFPC